jgi:hypothetical protein
MKIVAATALAGLALVGTSTLSFAQVQPSIDCTLSANMNLPACSNRSGAVVNHGSGAVGTIGPGENPASTGIGGSGSVPPPAARVGGAETIVPPAPDARGNAVVNRGTGAVGTLGAGESTGSVGIGGSGSSAPAAAQTQTRPIVPPAPDASSGAVVNRGTGAVNPVGPGESPGSAGIGGSGTSAPVR